MVRQAHHERLKLMAVRQYSGNEHGIIKGIGGVNCVSVNLDTGEHWIVDWRVYDPDGDGKTKLGHVRDMFDAAIQGKSLPFRAVLMDSWYATKELMMHIGRAGKVFYCPLKSNRKVDDSGGERPYQAVAGLGWHDGEGLRGKRVKVHGFPMDYKVKLFRVAASDRLGICRHQRPVPGFRRRRPRHLPRPLENRAIPPRGQANARHGEMPMPQGPRPEEPHRLRHTRLALPDETRQKVENEYIRPQKQPALKVYEGGA